MYVAINEDAEIIAGTCSLSYNEFRDKVISILCEEAKLPLTYKLEGCIYIIYTPISEEEYTAFSIEKIQAI